MEEVHRVFIGGLFDSITDDELKTRFQSFGSVSDVTIIHKRDGEGNISKTFGYVNLLTSNQKLNRCFAVFGGTKWKGHELKVQIAKEDFMARLKRERLEPDVKPKSKKRRSIGPTKTYSDILETISSMKRIVPGTPVEGEKDWVVAKYGRPLPILNIPKAGGRKTVKVDPSKFCHCLKRLVDTGDDDVDVNNLTWTYNDTDMILKKKKKRKNKKEYTDIIPTNVSDVSKDDDVAESETQLDKKKRKKSVSDDQSSNDKTLTEKHERKKKKKEGKRKENVLSPVLLNDNTNDTIVKKSEFDIGDIESSDYNAVSGNKKLKLEESILRFDSTQNLEQHKIKSDELKKVLPDNNVPPRVDGGKEEIDEGKEEVDECKEEVDGGKEEIDEGKEEIDEGKEEVDEHKEKLNVQVDIETEKEITVEIKSKITIPTFASEEVFIPEFSIDSNDTPACDDTIKENVLSTSIIEQLLSLSQKKDASKFNAKVLDTHLGTGSGISALNNPPKSGDEKIANEVQIDDSHEDIDKVGNEVENLFDFEFEDIGGKNKSFLDSLLGNIEVREDVDGISETIISSEDESTCSDESVVSPDDDNKDKDNSNVECEALSTDDNDNSNKICVASKVSEAETVGDKPDDNKRIKKLKILNSNKQEKHALSEEKRKMSLEARNSQIMQNKGLVSKALKEVDKSVNCTNRIVFSDSDGDEESSPTVDASDQNKIQVHCKDNDNPSYGNESRKQATLFDDTDEEDDASEDEIVVKPQFQGKEGEKLFKMQQKFGGDERFKLDERFAETDATEEKDTESIEDVEDDENDIQKEKEMNISVLEQILGKSVTEKKEREFKHQRYDPDDEEHEKFEIKTKSTDIIRNEDEDEEAVHKIKKAPPVVPLPEVSKDTYYSVNESLKDLFGKSESSSSFSFLGGGSSSSFSFLGGEGDEKSQTEDIENSSHLEDQSKDIADEPEEENIKVPSWKKGLKDMLASGQEEPEENIIETEKVEDEKHSTYLFFPDDDERLNIGRRFKRTEGIEEITSQWRTLRKTLTEDYKKKHKDAVRRVRKQRESRFSRR